MDWTMDCDLDWILDCSLQKWPKLCKRWSVDLDNASGLCREVNTDASDHN